MTTRRELTLVVALCAAGAVVALLAAGRTWQVLVSDRPAPLPDLRLEQTGRQWWPVLPASGWLALAAAGALLATRGRARQVVGCLLVLAGLAIALPALVSAVTPGAVLGWPALAFAGGLTVAAAGMLTAVRGRRWPAMAARYERTVPAHGAGAPGGGAGAGRGDEEGTAGPASATDVWDALDRGEDPT